MKIFIVSIIIISLSFNNCGTKDENAIKGTYKIDKYVLRNQTSKEVTYPLLSIKPYKTFKLHDYKNQSIEGTWKISESSKRQIVIQFYFSGKVVNGVLKKNIIYFEYPNDLYSGKYNKILYVKLNKDID